MNPVEPYDEKELLARFRTGDVDAFTQLYHRYSGQIYYNVLRMVKDEHTAEEIVQEMFVKVWQKCDTIQAETNFAAFLYRVGQNMVIDFYRKLQRDRTLYANFKAIATEGYSHIEEDLLYHESEGLLQDALGTLSPQQQKVYRLCKLDGHTYKEAAEIMGISVYTVKEYLSQASRAVRSYFMEHHAIVLLPLLLLAPFR